MGRRLKKGRKTWRLRWLAPPCFLFSTMPGSRSISRCVSSVSRPSCYSYLCAPQSLDVIDDTTSSRVLLSSRVRGLLERADDIVDVGLPTEDEAVSMLLSTAGMKLDTTPPEALAIVKFCNLLPLAIGIAVRLTASISICCGDFRMADVDSFRRASSSLDLDWSRTTAGRAF